MNITTKQITLLFLCVFSFGFLTAQEDTKAKAETHYELHSYQLALKEYKKLHQMNPDDVAVMGRIANCYRYMNRMNRAAEYYEKIISKSNIDQEYFFQYGLVLKSLERYDEARRWFLEYAKKDKETGTYFANSCDFAKKLLQSGTLFIDSKEYMNTADSDFGLTFYGNKMVYSSSRTDVKNSINNNEGTNWTGDPKNQLFSTSLDRNKKLQQPTLLKKSFQTRYNEGPISYSRDRRKVVYTKNNFVNGVRQLRETGIKLKLYTATVKTESEWTDIEAFPYNSNDHSTGYPYLDNDGKTLYFASDRAGGYGGFDLYVSTKTKTGWTTPKNLGPEVNSKGDEITPFVAGNILYFASDWHYGLGGFDVFRAEKTGQSWSKVTQLGKGVNSSYDDFGFIYNNAKQIGYFTSNRAGGKGNEDIYGAKRSNLKTETQSPPTAGNDRIPGGTKPTPKPPSSNKPAPPKPTYGNSVQEEIEMVVLNSVDKTPIVDALLDFRKCGSEVFKTGNGGSYVFKAQDLNCDVLVTMEGYETKMINLKTVNKKNRYIEVLLDRNSDKFYGLIIDDKSRLPLNNVFVEAINLNSNARITARSDSDGRYSLGLAKGATYLLKYSKERFVNTTKEIKTANGLNRNILGVQEMSHSGTSHTQADIDRLPPNTRPQPPVTTDKKAETVSLAFEIQVGAFKNPDEASIERLRDFGNVYFEPAGEYKRYKVGAFKTKAEAEAVKAKLVSELGAYSDAIITVTRDANLIGRVFIPDAGVTTTNNTPTNNYDTRPPSSTGTVYRIQIGAYGDPNNFDGRPFNGLGAIKMQKKPLPNGKEITIVMLGDYTSKAEAEKVKAQVKERGIEKPFMVTYKDGKRVN